MSSVTIQTDQASRDAQLLEQPFIQAREANRILHQTYQAKVDRIKAQYQNNPEMLQQAMSNTHLGCILCCQKIGC